jgi:hypothetical protein
MKHRIELEGKNIKTIILAILHKLKNAQERLSLKRAM